MYIISQFTSYHFQNPSSTLCRKPLVRNLLPGSRWYIYGTSGSTSWNHALSRWHSHKSNENNPRMLSLGLLKQEMSCILGIEKIPQVKKHFTGSVALQPSSAPTERPWCSGTPSSATLLLALLGISNCRPLTTIFPGIQMCCLAVVERCAPRSCNPGCGAVATGPSASLTASVANWTASSGGLRSQGRTLGSDGGSFRVWRWPLLPLLFARDDREI